MDKISEKLWNLIETVARAVFGLVFKICKIEPTEEQRDSLMQFVKFGLVGVWNTVFSYAITVVCLLSFKRSGTLQFEVFATPAAVYVSNIIAFIISVFVSFLLNNKFVFTLEKGQSRSFGKALFKSYLSYGFTGIILNNILAFVWVGLCGIPELIAPLISLVIAIPINFFMNKLWAFKSGDTQE